MTELSEGNITLKIERQTIRNRMYATTIYQKILEFNEGLVDKTGINEMTLNNALADYGLLSVRCKVVKGKLDFEFALHNDTSRELEDKFLKFIDSEHLYLLDDVTKAINKLDRVQDKTLAPAPLPDDADKKK